MSSGWSEHSISKRQWSLVRVRFALVPFGVYLNLYAV